MNGTQPRYSPAGRKMGRAQCHHVHGYISNSKVSLGFQDWKGGPEESSSPIFCLQTYPQAANSSKEPNSS